jgi:rhodanese-related sulfurtransferase
MKVILLITLVFAAVGFTACQNNNESEQAKPAATAEIKQVSVAEAKPLVENTDVQFIDVRTVEEYKGGHATGAKNFPLDELENLTAKLDKEKPVYIICQTGRRSQKGAEILQKNGFTDITNIQGGTSAWRAAGFETEK